MSDLQTKNRKLALDWLKAKGKGVTLYLNNSGLTLEEAYDFANKYPTTFCADVEERYHTLTGYMD